jgi:hypothetical protein
MNAKFVNARNVIASCLLAVLYFGAGSHALGQAPSILTQPQSQTNDYGSDTVFTVTATGAEPMFYRWQKGGTDLANYNNIAGANTPTLNLVGIAANDEAVYRVVIANASGSVTSSAARLTLASTIPFADDFTSGLNNWRTLLDSLPMGLMSPSNGVNGQFFAAAMTNSTQRMYHSLGMKLRGQVRLTFWMYDDGSTNTLAYGEIRGYSGASGYGRYATPYALLQSIGIGMNCQSAVPGVAMKGEILDPAFYQGRILRGTNAGWFNLNAEGAPQRSRGMHEFVIDRLKEMDIVDFYVDGVRTRRMHGATQTGIDTVMIGSRGTGASNQLAAVPGLAWFQSVKVEEFDPTFDYQSLASDGVFPDWMKLRETGTNAQIDNVAVATVSELAGSATNDSLGSWATDNSGVYALGPRGYLDYALTTPTDDAYRLEIEGREYNHKMPIVELPLVLWLDGAYLGQFNLPYNTTSNGLVHCFTPFIRSGTHTLRVLWDSSAPRRSLYLHAIRLQSLSSGYTDGNGIKTWEANRLAAQSAIEFAPPSSAVSPVCIEGREQYLKMMSLSAGTNLPLSPITVAPGAGYRWYANVPLSSSNVTRVEASFQNGALKETNDITWEVTDLLQASNLTIRKGDSLLFNAVPTGASNGTVTISISGAGEVTTDIATPVPYQFNQPGTFTVIGSYGSPAVTGGITVTVVNVSLPASIAAMGFREYWDCTNLVDGVVLDSDPRLGVTPLSAAARNNIDPTLPPLPENGRTYRIRAAAAYEPRYLVARLGQNGPILGRTAVLGFHWFTPPDASLKKIGTQDDGGQVIEGTYILSPVLTNLTASFEIVSAGVTFDDGTISRSIGPSDFDSMGIYRLRYIRAPGVTGSVCTITRVFDNGVMIARK